jgi:hypothetical protein
MAKFESMDEQLNKFASNYLIIIPIALILTFVFYNFERTRHNHPSKNAVFNQGFLYRLLTFVAILTFGLVYANKPLPGLEETINVAPADF